MFHTIFYQPIFNALIALYHYLPGHDLGIAIIGVTIATLSVLYWPSLVQIRSSQELQQLQPKLKALQKQHAGNREELAKQTMALYRQHRVNPLSSCLPLLIQLPFFFAMYQVFFSGLNLDSATHLLNADQLKDLYGPLRSIYETTPINVISFGFLNLTAKHNIILALAVGVSQFFLTRAMAPTATPPNVPGAKDERTTATLLKQMNHIAPFSFAFISYLFPAGLSLYYITWNIFQLIQRRIVARTTKASVAGTSHGDGETTS